MGGQEMIEREDSHPGMCTPHTANTYLGVLGQPVGMPKSGRDPGPHFPHWKPLNLSKGSRTLHQYLGGSDSGGFHNLGSRGIPVQPVGVR